MSTAPAQLGAMAAPAAAASSRGAGVLSRADLLRAARSGGSRWSFLPLALAALRHHPDDHELRFLTAAAFARLGLRTAAADHLDLLPAELRTDEGVAALTAAVQALPDDRITIESLEAVCSANLRALASRPSEPLDLHDHLPAWRDRAGRWSWFKSRGGHIVRRRREARPAGLNDEWLQLADIRSQLAAVTLPHAAAGAVGAVKPYIVEGIDPPWLVERILRETPAGADGYHSRVTIIHEDPLELLDGLAQMDLRGLLGDSRVRILVGPGAGEQLVRTLLASLDTQILGHGLSLSTVRTSITPSVETALQLAGKAQLIEQQKLLDRVRATYRGRDRAWWARRFEEGLSPRKAGRPLRILIPTCRFSTYIRHASADLAQAFGALGFEARTLIEPDAHAQFSGVAYLRAIADFEPDLIILINYARANINGSAAGTAAAGVIPLEVPYVMWVQDAMPHQLDERIGRGMTELDFVAGNLRSELFWRFAYPRARALDAPIVASSAKFHPGPISRELHDRHACEIAYVSHHAETPEAMHGRKCREARNSPGLANVLERLRPGVERETAAVSADPLSFRLRSVTSTALRDNGGNPDDPRLVEQLMQMYAMPMADRLLRHQTLTWAAEIAARRGWRLHVYGRGWDKHPTLAPFARGELAHGEDLRASYQSAAVHLQVSAHSIIHQRLIECVLSGGLPLSRLTEEDLSALSYLAAIDAARRLDPSIAGREFDLALRANIGNTPYRYVGFAVADCPAAMQLVALRQRLGLGEPAPTDASAFLWLNSVHLDRLRGRDQEGVPLGEVPRQRSLFWLLGDPAECVFTDCAGFEVLLERAIESPEWRERTATALRDRFRQHLTHESFATKLTRFIADRLSAASLAEVPRT